MNTKECTHSLRLLVVGAKMCGKTTMIQREVMGREQGKKYEATRKCDRWSTSLTLHDGTRFICQVWDTPGVDPFLLESHNISSEAAHSTNAVLIMCNTREHEQGWMDHKFAQGKLVIVLNNNNNSSNINITRVLEHVCKKLLDSKVDCALLRHSSSKFKSFTCVDQ